MPVKSPDDKRFRRAQVKPSRKRRSWGRVFRIAKHVVATVIFVYACVTAVRLVGNASVFRIRHIVVLGNQKLSTGEVMSLLTGLREQNILTVDLDNWRTRLMASSWVGDAALRRVLPATVEVLISERSPLGIGRINGQLYLVDDHGAIIDQYGPHHVGLDLPIIDGLASTSKDGAAGTDAVRAELAARLLDDIGRRKDLTRRVSQIDVKDPHDAVVILEGDPALLHLGESKFLDRLNTYTDLAPALRDRMHEIDYVDLRFDERLYVRPSEVAQRELAQSASGAPAQTPPASPRQKR